MAGARLGEVTGEPVGGNRNNAQSTVIHLEHPYIPTRCYPDPRAFPPGSGLTGQGEPTHRPSAIDSCADDPPSEQLADVLRGHVDFFGN